MLTQGTQSLARQLIESGSPRIQLPDEFPAHVGTPETSHVIGNAGDRFVPGLGAKEIPDIVRHLYQVLCVAHGETGPGGGPPPWVIRPCASPRFWSARLGSSLICGSCRYASSAIR